MDTIVEANQDAHEKYKFLVPAAKTKDNNNVGM